MITVDLTGSKILEPLEELAYVGGYIDLHNDYYCTDVKQLVKCKEMQLQFTSSGEKTYQKVTIKFKDVEIKKMSLPLQNKIYNGIIVDTFYRGRYEEHGNLREYSDTGKGYYYITFDEGYYVELLSNSVSALLG